MPALEMAQDAGTLVRWLKSEGQFVRKGEPLMEIETDKALVEIEATDSGTLANITAQPGDEVAVGKVIAFLLVQDDAGSQVPASGALEIRVESEPAKKSRILHFEVPAENGVPVTDTPTAQPSSTPSVTPSPTPPPTAVVTSTSTTPLRPNFFDWLIAITIASLIGFLSFRIAAYTGQVRWGVRGGFMAVIGGLLAYSILVLGSTGSHDYLQSSGGWGVILITLLGSATGIVVAWLWRSLTGFRLKDNI